MSTARRLIYNAYREGNIIPANTLLTASDAQNAEALPLLNGMLFMLVGEVIGAEPRDWPVPPVIDASVTPYWNKDPMENPVAQQPSSTRLDFENSSDTSYLYPAVNSRLISSISQATTVFMPPSPDDGSLMAITDLNSAGVLTLDGNGRFIDDAATKALDPVSSFNGKVFMYSAEDANWRLLDDMTIDSESPLPEVFDDLLSLQLYFRIAPRNGSTPSTETIAMYKKLLNKLVRRYRSRQPLSAPAKGPRNSIQEYSGTFGNRRA